MSPLACLLLGLGVVGALRHRLAHPVWWGAAIAVAAAHPAAGALVAAGAALIVWLRRRRAGAAAAWHRADEVELLARSLLVALTAGLPLAAALEQATVEVAPTLLPEIAQLLRRSHRSGLAAALPELSGELRPLGLILARAQLTGAAVVPAVAGFVTEQRIARRARTLEEARTLPVRLVVPLALLILPGFVLVTAGPAVLASLGELLGPVLPVP